MFELHIGLILSCLLYTTSGTKTFCYYSTDSIYRQGAIGRFLPNNVDVKQCTHLIFAFVDVKSNLELGPTHDNDLGPNGLYAQTTNLKQLRPGLKVLMAVGGWTFGSKPFVNVVKDWNSRNIWVKNVVEYLRKYNFDGMDMDWEFPGVRGSPPEDKPRFSSLMRMIQRAFIEEALMTGREKLLLTLATAAGSHYIQASYEPAEVIQSVDYMLLMAYNYHGQWENTTGHHSSLYPNKIDKGKKLELNQIWSINYWLNQGMPRDRLIVGLGTYGMSYTLKNQWQNGVGAPAVSGGRPGEYTGQKGVLAYFEICEKIKYKGWTSVWIEEQQSPYAFGGDQWVGYDNPKSISIKARYIRDNSLGGAFVWSVDLDDFSGSCGEGMNPILTAINKIIKPTLTPLPTLKLRSIKPEDGPGGLPISVLDNKPPLPKPEPKIQVPKPQPQPVNQPAAQRPPVQRNPEPAIQPVGEPIQCKTTGPGSHPDPNNCHNFYYCIPTGRKFTRYHLACPGNTGFDVTLNACMWMVNCQI